MAKDADMNKRILRYLGYAAYENGNFDESKKALDDFIANVEASRVISQDYLFLGMSEVNLATDTVNNTINAPLFTEGVTHLKTAIETDSAIAEDLNDLGTKLFRSKQYVAASQIFELGASVETSKNSVTDHFYLGYSLYFDYVTRVNDEEKPDKDLLKRAARAFAQVGEIAPTFEDAYLYQAKSEYLLEDPENPKGGMVSAYEKFIEVTTEKGPQTIAAKKRFLVEAHNVLGAYFSNLGNLGGATNNYAKARVHFEDTLMLDPANEYASQSLDNLKPSK